MTATPFEQINKELSEIIPKRVLELIPDKWEKIGDVLTIRLPNSVNKYYSLIGEKYAEILGCKTVLNDISGISGEFREPIVEKIYGSEDTVTIHKENGIRYKLDPSKIMFSSGNMDERIRISKISNPDETVVDMFAGIGYFTLPIAVHSRPKKIFAVEKNPVAYNFLCENIVLNYVSSIVEPIKGDNRHVTPKNIADRAILGYIGDTHRFLPIAFECLKNNTGIIHYHDKFPEEKVPEKPMKIINEIAKQYNRNTKLTFKHVKSYAPGISHYVIDIMLTV